MIVPKFNIWARKKEQGEPEIILFSSATFIFAHPIFTPWEIHAKNRDHVIWRPGDRQNQLWPIFEGNLKWQLFFFRKRIRKWIKKSPKLPRVKQPSIFGLTKHVLKSSLQIRFNNKRPFSHWAPYTFYHWGRIIDFNFIAPRRTP